MYKDKAYETDKKGRHFQNICTYVHVRIGTHDYAPK